MAPDDIQLAKAKYWKDVSDAVFRVIQMMIVLALVSYLYQETKSGFALLAGCILPGFIFIYSRSAMAVATLDFQKVVGQDRFKTTRTFMWLATIITTVVVCVMLMFSPIIINEINRVSHAVGQPRADQSALAR